MSRTLIAFPLFVALAACSGEPDQAARDNGADAAVDAGAVAADGDVDADGEPAGASPAAAELPYGLRLDAEKLLVEERNYLTGSKAQRRRTTFQFSGTSADAVAEDLRQQMVAAGFRERVNESVADGKRLGFAKRDTGRVNIRVVDAVENALLDGATGEAFFDWQLVAAPGADEPEEAEGDVATDAGDATDSATE